MAIMVIEGPAQSGKTLLANSLRNGKISSGQGALVLDNTHKDHDPTALIEKLIDTDPLPAKVDDLTKIKWKKNPLVVVVGSDGLAKLEQIEKRLPGFKKYHGPVTTLATDTK